MSVDVMNVEIRGDATSYQKMLAMAQAATKSAMSSIGNMISTLGGSSASSAVNALTNVASTALNAVKNAAESVLVVSLNAVTGTLGALQAITGNVLGGLYNLFGSVFSAIGNVVKNGLNILLSLPDALLNVYKAFKDISQEMIDTDNKARKLGLTTLELNAAMLWSGVSQAKVESALATTQKKLSELGAGSRTAAQDFAALANASGTSAERIKEGGWAAVYDSIAAITDPTMRAAMAFRFMGDNAGDFLGQLDRGAGAQSGKDVAKKMGLGADAGEMASLRQVSETIRQVESLVKGVFNQIVLAIAPIIAELGKMFDPSSLNLEWIRKSVQDMVKSAALLGAAIYEAFQGNMKPIQAFFEVLGKGVDWLAQKIVESIGSALRTVGSGIDSYLSGSPEKGKMTFYGNIKYLFGGGNPVLDELERKNKEAEDEVAESSRANLLKSLEKLQNDPKLTDKQRKIYHRMAREAVTEGAIRIDDVGGFDNASKVMRVVLDAIDEKDYKTAQKALTDAKVFKNVKKESKSAVSPVTSIFDEVMKSDSGKSVEDFFARITKQVEKFNDAGRETVPAFRINELVKQFDSLRTASRPAIDQWGSALNEFKQIDALLDPRRMFMGPLRPGEQAPGNAQYEEQASLIAAKMFRDLQSGVGIGAIPQLAGAAEDRTREAYSSAAQYSMLADRGDIQQQIRVAIELGNQQRQAQIRIGEETLKYIRGGGGKQNATP